MIDLFAIDIPAPFVAGRYSGTFGVLGGSDENAQDVLGSVDFSVQVRNTSTVPEPTCLCLCTAASFMLLVFQVAYRKLRREQHVGLTRLFRWCWAMLAT